MKMKEIGIWAGVILVFVAISWGLVLLVNSTSTPNSNAPIQTKTPAPVSKNDITLGLASAKVILIEYADFQCPACKAYSGLVKQLNRDFGNNLLITYRFLPLTDAHRNALTSAQAAYAAFKQNKFWEMDGLLYENQDSWAEADNALQIFTDYAKKLNLNIDQFTQDYSAQSTLEFIDAQNNEGVSLGITYAPSFFVNGKLIKNPQNYDSFKQVIQNALNNK